MTRFANSVTFLFGFQSQVTPMAKQFLDLLLVNVSSMNFTSVSFFLGGKKIFRGEGSCTWPPPENDIASCYGGGGSSGWWWCVLV